MTKGRILIVEDEAIVARDIEERLQALGYESAGIASTAEEALTAAAAGKPVLALMDIHIRGAVDGIAAAQELSSRFGIPSIFLTAYSDDGTLRRATAANPYGYILKPFDDRDLKSGLELALFRNEAEARVRASETRFTSAFEYAAIGMALVAPDGQWLRVNRSLCGMLGYSEQELLAGRFQDITVPEDLPADLESVGRVLAGEIATYQMEKRYQHRDGHVVWALLSVSLVRDAEGLPVHFISQVQDISARKEAERQRSTTLEILETLNRTSDLGQAAARLIGVIQRETGIEAIAIRTAREGDFRYLAHSGFPKSFVDAEDHLCAMAGDGSPLVDPDGRPRLECTCGLILEGGSPKGLTVSPGGSAWTNDPASIPSLPDGADRRLNPRNLCITQGYRSIALIPIRSASGVLGLLQLNDRRPGQFSEEKIGFLERLASSMGIALDRRQAEERLRYGLAHLGLTLDAAGAGTWEWDLRTNENVWSDSLWKLYGLDRTTAAASYEAWRQVIVPEDRDRAEQTVQKAAREGTELNAEWRVRLPSGEIRWLVSRGKPLRGPEGRIDRYLGMVMDVTENREAEGRLIELKTAVEQATDGIAITDMEGVIRFVNKAWADMHGWSAEVSPGTPLSVFHTAEQFRSDVQPHLVRLMERGHHAGDVSHVRADGSEFSTSMSTSVLRTPAGAAYGMLAIARDITEHRKMQQELEAQRVRLAQADRLQALGELAAGVAHELNQPLTGIRGFAEGSAHGLRSGWQYSSEELCGVLDDIVGQVDRMTGIIDHMRAFSRGHGGTDPQRFRLSEPVEGALKLMAAQLRAHGIALDPELGHSEVICCGWPFEIEQVILNMLSNARDALQDRLLRDRSGDDALSPAWQACIRLSTFVNTGSGECGIAVSDTGGGIPDGVAERVFEPFYTTKPVGKGTGLGLSIAQGIMSRHNGRIEVDNRPGDGVTFRLVLPTGSAAVVAGLPHPATA